MKFNFNKLFSYSLIVGSITLFASCNKDVADPKPVMALTPTGQSISELIAADTSMSILQAGITRASTSTASPSLSALLSDRTATFTFFAPTNSALRAAFAFLGIPPAVGVNALRPGQLDTIIRYHLVGGAIAGAGIPSTFPNMQLPSQFVLMAPSAAVPPGLRMSIFASKRGTNFWVNNVPLIQTDLMAANGVMHKAAAVLLPPSQFLWDRINTDANLTYLKAAIQRADSGTAAAATLVAALQNPGANLTVYAPTDNAFRAVLTAQITAALIGQGVPPATAATTAAALAATPAVFTNPLLATVLTPTVVKGIVVYHLFGTRAFSVNLPATAAPGFPTLLNTAIPAHPGVTLQATFGPTGVSSATVKGVANGTASNIAINPTPAPGGTSDQHYINGVLHVIDQVLLPQ